MTDSETETAAGGQTATCLHVVGIGRSGVGYVDGLLRTGEIEDLLEKPGARFAALAIDIGDDDLIRAQDYADGFVERLTERGIPADRFHFQSVALDVPTSEELVASLGDSWLKSDIELPAAGGHFDRAVAKAICAKASGDESSGLDAALTAFAAHVEQTEIPSHVMVCFNLAGGTGSGMAVDLARQLANGKLGGKVPLIGVGQLPHSGDGAARASLYASLNEIDNMLDAGKNAELVKGQGEDYANPFSGGFFVVNTEHSWQRLTSYTNAGVPAVRDRIRQEVTNKFAQDSFMRFAARDEGGPLNRVLESGGSKGWTLFNLAKFTHPGVQVLPGEALSKWQSVIAQWVDHLDKFAGVSKDFHTNFAEVHVHVPREIGFEKVDAKLKEKIAANYLSGDDSNIRLANHEFFDHLTSYADIVLPGLAPAQLDAFGAAREAYGKLGAEQQRMCHSLLLDRGVVMA